MDIDFLTTAWEFVKDYWPYVIGVTGVSSVVVPAMGSAIFAYIRRPKSSTNEVSPYFTDKKLLSPPLARPAYSDRVAYILAEMSDLAYYQFEGQSDFLDDAVDSALALNLRDGAGIREFLDKFSTALMSERRSSVKFLKKNLANSGFSLLDVINVAETQGFVCKRTAANEPPYLVLAFRGTEKKASDWLTDARCVPAVDGKTKVHTGFLEAFTMNTDAAGRTVEDVVKEILDRSDSKDESGNLFPLFITGHSLGGALALLATKRIAPNVNGACYTFGAPRIGNYEYFRFIKTPVYRVVNSSDVVPRVPPGALMLLFRGMARAISWLTGFVPVFSSQFDKVEEFLDKLKGYRHYGDLRYLSDVGEGRFQDVRLLMNPPAVDRVVWMWRHLAESLFLPIKCHSMTIYRKKLAHIANERWIRQSNRKE